MDMKPIKDIIREEIQNLNPYNFFRDKTAMTYYDNMLDTGGVGIEFMTPDEYIFEMVRAQGGAAIEQGLHGVQPQKLEKILAGMKSGIKYDMPVIDYVDGFQEGRHRALAAKQLGAEKIPVAIRK
jgi:hypothetical protein